MAICPETQLRLPESGEDEPIRFIRMPLNILGDGFVEAIDDNIILAIAASQPGQSGGEIAGEVVYAPVLEVNSALRVGRFGKKNQFASLLDFAALAYLLRTTRCAILANAIASS